MNILKILLLTLALSCGYVSFVDAAVVLEVHKVGTGKGSIISTPAGINCTSSCVLDFLYVPAPTTVTLTVVPEPGSRFVRWIGTSCASATCQIPLPSNQKVTAIIDKIPGFIPPAATLTVAPVSLVFTAQQNGPQPPKQQLTITTTAAWSVSQVPSWLKLTLLKPNVLSLSIIQTGLIPGVYTANLAFKAPGMVDKLVPVRLTVGTTPVAGALFSVDKTTVTITGRQFGKTGTNPPPQTVVVNGVSTFKATTPNAWLRIDAFKGSFNIQALLAGMTPGQYQGQVLITTTEVTSPVSHIVLVTLNVTPAPTLLVFPSSLTFQGTSTLIPRFQTLMIGNLGTGSLGSISVTAGQKPSWLTLTSTPTTIVATTNPTGLADGTYTTSIAVASSTSLNGPVVIPITLNVVPPTAIIDTGTATLSWDKNADDPLAPTTGYRVYRSTVSGVYPDPYIMEIPHPINSAELLKDMPPGFTYFFTLTAFNLTGESLRSNEVSITFGVPLTTP